MVISTHNDTDFVLTHSKDDAPNPEAFRMHTHAFCEVFCFLSGTGTFHIEGSAYPLHPGDIVIMRPAEAHYIEIDPSEPYERISVHFDANLLSSLDADNTLLRPYFDRKAGKQNLYPLSSFESDGHLQHFFQMFRSCPNKRLNILANTILILQQISEIFCSLPAASMESDTVEYRIIRYINKNLQRNLPLQELCDKFFISKAQLCRRFKKSTGTTVAKYITVKRLVTSRQLILQGQRPTDIYTMFGFRDYSTFYRAYTKYFGHSPKQEADCDPIKNPETVRNIIA